MTTASSRPTARRIVLLTEGYTEPITAKTAASVIRYCPEEVVAVLDSQHAGKSASDLLAVDADVPIVGSLQDVDDANTLMIGIAPPGGKIPPPWRSIVLEAIQRKMNIVSGLHHFLSHDSQFAAAAAEAGVRIDDVRKNDERDVANREGIREDCFRVATVGNDCCVGKMVTAIEITRGLQARGENAQFVATGQTGIMISGSGCPIDCVVADFVNGAAERLILAHQHHDILVIEGQGSLAHPRYSSVTLGLLHGTLPHAMVMCLEAERSSVHGMSYIPLQPLEKLIEAYEAVAGLMLPSPVVAIAVNSRRLSAEAYGRFRGELEDRLQLPVADCIREGSDRIIEALDKVRREVVDAKWSHEA